MLNNQKNVDSIINLCKSRGFVFQGSEIYGGLANTWDYGPLGALMKNNIKNLWIKKFVLESDKNVLLDSAILMNPRVWEASGHLGGFSDMLTDCKNCKLRFRADKLIEQNNLEFNSNDSQKAESFIKENNIKCPNCGSCNFTPIRQFNLMFKTFQGVTEESLNQIFLRPETAQGIFVNFMNVARSTRKKIPFGVAQVGKSFRNEITPGNFLFRIREFEQMELEFFCKPGTDDEWFKYWNEFCFNWLKKIGLNPDNLRKRNHEKEELSHYSKATTDIEFLFPFGWGELWGIANRTNFDLTQHQKFSGKSFEYFDPESNEKYIPFVIEPSVGLDRLFFAILCDAYTEENLEENDKRIVLKINESITPFKFAVLPLSKKLSSLAFNIYENLAKKYSVDFDESGSIGKRYRRQDEIGTPYCVTVDFETQENNTVTIRHRDSMHQDRIKIEDIDSVLKNFY
ncbi:MAG: glycine--tRNA ligase [Clostridia bacterium]|nr:glycine--tRNA ligase [Clostridia bacterium]